MGIRRYLGPILGLLAVGVFLLAGLRHLDIQAARSALAHDQAEVQRLEIALAERDAAEKTEATPAEGQDEPEVDAPRFTLPEQAPRLALLEVLERAAHEAGVILDRVELPPRPRIEATRAGLVGRGSPTRLIDFLARIEARRELTLWASAWLRVDEEGVLSLHADVVAPSRAAVPRAPPSEGAADDVGEEGGDA